MIGKDLLFKKIKHAMRGLYKSLDHLTEDWFFWQIQHILRLNYHEDDLFFFLIQIRDRYVQEFIEEDKTDLVLARCLVGDEWMQQWMVLWVIDIIKINNETTVLRLSDYFYSINIILKPGNLKEDKFFLSKISDGSITLGTKIKCQNIQNTGIPLETEGDFTNPVVNAQTKDTFKLNPNSLEIVGQNSKIGRSQTPLYKKISEIYQDGGTTCNIRGVIAQKYPLFYKNGGNKYSKETYQALSEEINFRAGEQYNEEIEIKGKHNVEIDIEEVKRQYNFEPAVWSFAVLLRDEDPENKDSMFLQITKTDEQGYEALRVGDILDWNLLVPNYFDYDNPVSYTHLPKTPKPQNPKLIP